ncbi:MAG TPA: hypothetical protein VFS56_03585 [Gemmatimonadaceae bacterium]|nr:hypothetical protein [Gemmatimonadaceae bacterium]
MTPNKKKDVDEGAEFADFMADISQEISQRVESLDAALPAPAPPPVRKPAPPPVSSAAGMILEWDNVADRMIEEML